jgi:hypothetical protein
MVRRSLLRLALLAVAALCLVSRAYALAPSGGENETPPHTPVFSYFLAFLFTIITLVILCAPSRKS